MSRSLSRLVPLVAACSAIFACGGVKPGYAIDGGVKGCSTVTIRLSGAATRAATTGVDGTFAFKDLPDGSYTLTPELSNCTFTPASRTIAIHGGDAGSQDFIGQPTASWTATGRMSQPRTEHTATLLADGRVLVAGGEPSGSAEIFDPVSNGFSTTGALGAPRVEHVAVLLADGRVLVVGGHAFGVDGSTQELGSAELYDPGTGRFTPTGPMNRTRLVPGAVRLSDGRVLVAGGESKATNVHFLDDAELYDPASGQFTAAGAMATVSGRVALNLLTENLVLAVGEQGSADLYVPGGSFAATDPLPIRRGGSTAVPIGGNKVFVAGGTGSLPDAATAVYSYSLNHFVSGPLLLHPRIGHVMAPLPGGRALLAAGMQEGSLETLMECEVCSPAEGICTATGALAQGRQHTAAVALADGRVLVMGGDWIGPGSLGGVLATAEVYRPVPSAP